MGKFAVLGVAVLAFGLAACRADTASAPPPAASPSPSVSPSPSEAPLAVGQCLKSAARRPFDPRFYRATPIACEQSHALEVVLIGAAADGAAPPATGSAEYRAAYAACGQAVNAYVGGDWHDGLLGIDVQEPTQSDWSAGRRTTVCTVYGSANAYSTMIFRTGTLKDSLAGAAPAAMRCLEVVGEADADGWYRSLAEMRPIDCGQPHGAEYTGTVTVPGATLPAADELADLMIDACWGPTAKFLGLSRARAMRRADIAVTFEGMSENRWQSGDHVQRCYAAVPYARKVHASLRGLGSRALPT
ncbi:septum formation family protein [Dactylosporangium sp. NPDC051541]|uniref:septum formation family protein n=1 Tax=Dactylosporangium sp. NPDC051541 TaxID=3363977 RepID=UPI0037948066